MADGTRNDMDSLFEGMDFIMPDEVEDVSDPPVDKPRIDSILLPKENLNQTGSAAVVSTGVPVVAFGITPTRTSSSSSLSSLPSLARNTSGTLAGGQFSPSAPGSLQRDPSTPLDEFFFSGVSVSFMDGEVSNRENLDNSEGQSFASTGSSESSVQHRRAESSDGRPAAENVSSTEKDRPTVESIMTAYTTSAFKHSAPGYPPDSKAVPSLTSSPSLKQGIRRKKRSMKIGYGREEEEQEELALLRKTAAQMKTTSVTVGKDTVNGIYDSSPRLSVSSHGLSRANSQGQLDVEELSEGAGVSEESEISTRDVSGAETDKSEVSSASKLLEAQGSSSEVVSKPVTAESPSKVTCQRKESELQETRRIEEERQDVSSPAPETEHKSSLKEEQEKPCDEKPPDEILDETNRGNMEITSRTTEAAVAEVKVTEEERDAEPSISPEGDLDITSLAAKKVGSVEERLQYVQALLARALKELQRRSSVVSALRKAAVQERRQAAEKVSTASTRYKDLEAELNAACENEDFEKADSLSESFAEAENAMQQAAEEFKSAEANCDLASSKVQEILDLQVATEEEGVRLLTLLKQEAKNAAERARAESQERARRKMERLSADEEAAEARKRKLGLSRRVIEEANADLDKAIGEGTKAETQLKTSLTEQRSQLLSELEDLLALVRKKEAEIADCDKKIAVVDEKISTVVANFKVQRSSLEAETEALEASSLELEEVFKRIATEKQGVNELLADGEKEGLRFEEVSRSAADAVSAVQEALKVKKAIANTTSFYKQKNAELAEKEKTAHEHAQALRQDSLSGRSSLQELTTTKMKLNQDIAEKKQLILFVEKRLPELDAEKKLAAAARNFKEAGWLAAEAKALSAEKETATADMIRMSSELRNLEAEAEHVLYILADTDSRIADREKEAATARCERLRLIAAGARMERDTAIELEDFEEAESLDAEAEAADLEAAELQTVHQLEGGLFEKQFNSIFDQADNSSPQTEGIELANGVESQTEQTDSEVDGVKLERVSEVD